MTGLFNKLFGRGKRANTVSVEEALRNAKSDSDDSWSEHEVTDELTESVLIKALNPEAVDRITAEIKAELAARRKAAGNPPELVDKITAEIQAEIAAKLASSKT